MSRAKAKGTTAETAVTQYLLSQGINAVRNPLQGAKDKGDINIFKPIVLEVKNHRTMDLSTWVDEAQVEKKNALAKIGVVIHKRLRKGSPALWYATMTVEDLVKLIKAADFDSVE